MTLPDVFLYSDYRTYLRDYYESNKARRPDFSFRYLSQRAGINSSAFYKYVIDGKRNLTKGSLLKTCLALKLKERDAEYFENLVFYNQAKAAREKAVFAGKLAKIRGEYAQRRVHKDQYAFYGAWYHSAVRELLGAGFRGDYEELAARLVPSITPARARASVALLARLGMARKDAQGRWRAADPVLSTGGQVDARVVTAFQKRMLALASRAFTEFKAEERLMSSTTFGISEATFELFKRRIRELKSELLEAARLDPGTERVYQLNVHFFPLSRKPGRSS